MENMIWFCCKFSDFPVVKEFLKYDQELMNTQSLVGKPALGL